MVSITMDRINDVNCYGRAMKGGQFREGGGFGEILNNTPMTPNFRRPVLFMYERFLPPGFHAGSICSTAPVAEVGGCGDDILVMSSEVEFARR